MVLSISTGFLCAKYSLIIFSTEDEIGREVGNFIGILDVSFVISSLDHKLRTKLSAVSVVMTFVMLET